MKAHTTIGYNILDNPKSDILNCGRQVAVSHHEKWNGKGYPYGLAGEDIYLSGRIVCIADVFDALTSVRPYKNPYPIEVAVDIIKKDREQHFDPDITDIFLDNIDEIIKIKEATSPGNEQAIGDFVWSERDKEDGTCQAVTDLNKQKNKNTA